MPYGWLSHRRGMLFTTCPDMGVRLHTLSYRVFIHNGIMFPLFIVQAINEGLGICINPKLGLWIGLYCIPQKPIAQVYLNSAHTHQCLEMDEIDI